MKHRILVIDDEAAIRNSFLLTFEDSGLDVEVAATGLEGLSKLEESVFDLIFLDLRMPDLNGVEVLQRIRQRNPGIPLYIVTAFHTDYMKELEAARSKGLEFELLQKPLGSNQLRTIVSSLLDYRSGT